MSENAPPTQQEEDEYTLSVQLANQIINIANSRLEDGMRPDIIAAGLRHAAANFSAFVSHHIDPKAVEEGRLTEDFHRMLEYYTHVHGGGASNEPATGLHQLINQVKDEL